MHHPGKSGWYADQQNYLLSLFNEYTHINNIIIFFRYSLRGDGCNFTRIRHQGNNYTGY